MATEGVHTARQMPPGRCDKIRTKDITDGVQFNYCVRGTKATEVESVHFDAKKFTPEEARAWLKKHQFSTDEFVPAKPAKANAGAADEFKFVPPTMTFAEFRAAVLEARPELACQMMDVGDCPMSGQCPMQQLANKPGASPTYADAGEVEIRAAATGTCEIEAQAAGGADALPRVSMLAYTGVPMKLEGFHLPVVVDLETLRVPKSQKVPILRAHDDNRIAGHSDSIKVTAQTLRAGGVLSGVQAHTADLTHTAKNGFPWQVSIGAATTKKMEHVPAGETVKVNGRNWDGPLLVARHSLLRELSLLPMGADGNTEAGLSGAAVTDVGPADAQGG